MSDDGKDESPNSEVGSEAVEAPAPSSVAFLPYDDASDAVAPVPVPAPVPLPLPSTTSKVKFDPRGSHTNNWVEMERPDMSGTTKTLVVQPHNATRVIKGEIHNVLTVMRADARYASTMRFEEELLDDEHPLLVQFRSLHATICEWEASPQREMPDTLVYLPPFCSAISGREISASITGAALTALHKFLLYGFILPTMPHAEEGMTLIATSLLSCTFEETADTSSNPLELKRRGNHNSLATVLMNDDEQVVLKLLELSALVVRCSLISTPLITTDLVVGLLETCLHVSHRAKRASPLLKSAAADALGQIVLQVFAGTGEALLEAREEILAKLASLLNPQQHNDATCATSLTLVNIAFETLRENFSNAEIGILQNDLCKYLLQWSTTHDLIILNLTLRVIFNLFQSMRNQMKVPLEVFLTSVHLRILDPSSSATNEEREVALESLLEFCQEIALMQDIYLNYDCDISCTNLYEMICMTLGRVATNDHTSSTSGHGNPSGGQTVSSSGSSAGTSETSSLTSSLDASIRNDAAKAAMNNSLNLHRSNHGPPMGIGNGAISAASIANPMQRQSFGSNSEHSSATTSQAIVHPQIPLTVLNRLALDGILAILDCIYRKCQGQIDFDTMSSFDGDESTVGGDFSVSRTAEVTKEELQERKRKKQILALVSSTFSDDPTGEEWIVMATESELLPADYTAKDIAHLLYTTPNIDKAGLGQYLSKGPPEKFPFHAKVRQAFAELFDFADMPFATGLRKYLAKFRLPGEAQCIDRMMEVFSKEYYSQQTEDVIFKNSDSVYVLSFSTIMLNTDLHNPNLANNKRMTLQEFIKNNRGINDSEDLPEDLLTELYQQIKEKEIKVKADTREMMPGQDFRASVAFDWMAKSEAVAEPFFTPYASRQGIERAGVHDKEMFITVSRCALKSLSEIFGRSWDDALVIKAIRGLKQMAKMCDFFDVSGTLNEIVQVLLSYGRDYIVACTALEYGGYDNGAPILPNGRLPLPISEEADESQIIDVDAPLPKGVFFSDMKDPLEEMDDEEMDVTGSAAHRGLLALDCALIMLRTYASRIREAWPTFCQCICALRDARGLPEGLADLDDFADSNGNVLPLSVHAQKSKRRLDDCYRSMLGRHGVKKKGWLKNVFSFGGKKTKQQLIEESERSSDSHSVRSFGHGELSAFSLRLLSVAENADVEKMVHNGSTKWPAAEFTIQSLLDTVADFPYDDDPIMEQHAIFSLELAARALLTNKEKATDLFMMFLTNFEAIFSRIDDNRIPAPFVVERVVVTILRSSIHLYDLPELRPNLRASLHLLMMSLPRKFIGQISDRMACGLAIILRASFHYFETPNEWTFMGDTLDMLANYSAARGFVFDGIASTVEYSLPLPDDEDAADDTSLDEEEEHPKLTKDACLALTRILIRFVLGFYQRDQSLTVPAMLCLEKVYRHIVRILIENEEREGEKSKPGRVPDKELWQNVIVSIYSVCRAPDDETSQHGMECYQRVMDVTDVEEVPDDKWLAILYLMVNKQPPILAEVSRGNTFALLGEVLMAVVGSLSTRSENWEDLTDLVQQIAGLAEENLREGRQGRVSPLFERTRETLTFMSNDLLGEEYGGSREFGTWASETLLAELEKVGAGGGAIKNVAATTRADDEPAAPDS